MIKIILFLICTISTCLTALAIPVKSSIAAKSTGLINTATNPLPDGLVAVQYLENTNAYCHVATPMRFCDIPYSAISLVYSIRPDATLVNRSIYGRQASSNRGYYNLLIGAYSLKYTLGENSPISLGTYDIKGAQVNVEIDMLNNIVKVNNTIINVDVASRWNTMREDLRTKTYSIFLFRDEARAPVLGLRIHAFKCWVNNTILCDLQPVRFLNDSGIWEGAYYDSQSGNLFKASGSVLVIGPDK